MNNILSHWWDDGVLDGLIVKPWVAIWLSIGSMLGYWVGLHEVSSKDAITFILLLALVILIIATVGCIIGAFIGAWPLKTYWNWRICTLHKFVHGQDGKQYMGQGSMSYWRAWVFAFMWQMGYRSEMRAFRREYQLALARRVGYS